MIFTIGDKASYDKGIAEKEAAGERLYKLGLCAVGANRTRGGAAFKTAEEAQAWIDANKAERPEAAGYAVYGLEADWERDTIQYEGEPYARLIINRPIVKLSPFVCGWPECSCSGNRADSCGSPLGFGLMRRQADRGPQ